MNIGEEDALARQIACPDRRCAVPAGWSCVYIQDGPLGLPRYEHPIYPSTHHIRRMHSQGLNRLGRPA